MYALKCMFGWDWSICGKMRARITLDRPKTWVTCGFVSGHFERYTWEPDMNTKHKFGNDVSWFPDKHQRSNNVFEKETPQSQQSFWKTRKSDTWRSKILDPSLPSGPHINRTVVLIVGTRGTSQRGLSFKEIHFVSDWVSVYVPTNFAGSMNIPSLLSNPGIGFITNDFTIVSLVSNLIS